MQLFSPFFFSCSGAHRDLHSFPTRRSSDLRFHGGIAERKQVFVRNARVRIRELDRKSTRLNSSHMSISYAVFCLKKKTNRPQSDPGTYAPASLDRAASCHSDERVQRESVRP